MRKFPFFSLIFYFLLISCGAKKHLINEKEIASYDLSIPKIEKINDSTLICQNVFLIKNQYKIYELYNSGNALQLGYNHGALAENLLHQQERALFSKVEEFVPSKFKQGVLRNLVRIYTGSMPKNVTKEFQAEIFGISRYVSDEFDFIAPKFQRQMILHAAHDIGHAMQDWMLVGCSSLAVWDENSHNGKLLIGRAFDFYAGDEFAENKLLQFVKPDEGIPFASVSWPGMIGVVSGMNVEGLSVTINAGKSGIPLSVKTPISLLTREILQFASTIDEAVEIAKRRKVFVAESIMVGSSKDRKAVIIEVSPKKMGVYEVENSAQLVCTNHFQSETFSDDRRNEKWKHKSHSVYRQKKINEFLVENQKLTPEKMAEILRERSGIKNRDIGNGNEKSINQLLAHHAVIFSPEEKIIWVSAKPYQLGEFVAYDLGEIFSGALAQKIPKRKDLTIAKDPFLDSEEFANYEKYRIADRQLDSAIKFGEILSEEWLENYRDLNPELWIVHFKSGKYYFEKGDFREAKKHFETALTKEISSVPEKETVEKYLRKTRRKIQH
ncbi:C45 family autoproteolytic acyltransferase/hydrolase [Cruoricaptor ignavus]|uniref:C45 family autoproteolytic acyltransferase/hydolase n=1 Tax=Cruoricaptor ignavus TaxID=1118202 RepID=UPI00370DAE78